MRGTSTKLISQIESMGVHVAEGILTAHKSALVTSTTQGDRVTYCFDLQVCLTKADSNLTATDDTDASSVISLNAGGARRLLRILVVEDSALCRKMTVKKIKAYCSLLYEAEDGMAAVTAYQSALEQGIVFDAILMDSSMPCMDGKSD
jgi:hypothetical protein